MRIHISNRINHVIVTNAKVLHLISATLLAVTGILIMAIPAFDGRARFIVLGVVSILIGGTGIFGYFSNDAYRLAFQSDFALGIFTVFFGVLLIQNPQDLPELLPCAAGIIVLLDGGNKSQIGLEGIRFGLKASPLVLVSAAAEIFMGCAVLFCATRDIDTRYWVGSALLISGVVNFWTTMYMVRIRNHRKPALDADAEE